jgi:hypothetical protein
MCWLLDVGISVRTLAIGTGALMLVPAAILAVALWAIRSSEANAPL